MATTLELMQKIGAKGLAKVAFQPMPAGQQMDQMPPEQLQEMGVEPEAAGGQAEQGQGQDQGQQPIPMVGEMPADQFMQMIQEVMSGAMQQIMPQIQQMLMAMAPQEGGKGKGAQGELGAKLDQIIALMGGVLPSNGVPPGAQAGQVPPGGAAVPPMAAPGQPAPQAQPMPAQGGQPGMQVSASFKPKLADILATRVKALRG